MSGLKTNIRPIASEDSTARALSSCCMRFKRARIPDVLRIRVVDRGVSQESFLTSYLFIYLFIYLFTQIQLHRYGKTKLSEHT